MKRCSWPGEDSLMLEYHDKEWGRPLHDDRKIFEFLVLDAFQAGLSWRTVLHKRKNFEKAFVKFDAKKIVKFGAKDVARLMNDVGIIRNRLKIIGTIENAKQFLKVQKEWESFDKYIWQFTDGKTIRNKWKTSKDLPAVSKEAEAMSRDLKSRGFKFVGPTICYAFMQAAGMVNDHLTSCFRYK